MKLTGLEIPSIYKNVNEYLLFDYTDEIQLGKELCSVKLMRLDTADLFKNRISKSLDDENLDEQESEDNYMAVITIADHVEVDKKYSIKNESGNFIDYQNLKNVVLNFILDEVYEISVDKLEISIKI